MSETNTAEKPVQVHIAVAKGENPITYNFTGSRLENIEISKIVENSDSLRPVVDKTTIEYKQLADSVKRTGVMNAISVRPVFDPVDGSERFGLIDGLHRLNAAMDAGHTTIPAQIVTLKDADLLEAQIIANVQKIETPNTQLVKALLKILAANPTMTVGDLCVRINKEAEWFYKRLGLLKLTDELQAMVDDGTLILGNAFVLATLPKDKQAEYTQQAVTLTAVDFKNRIDAVKAELAKAKKEGRQANVDVFTPAAKLRPLPQLKDELDLITKAPTQSKLVRAAQEAGIKTLEDAIAFGVKYAMNMDPASIEAQKNTWEAEKKDKADKAAAKAKEKEDKAKAKALSGIG